MTTSKAKSEPAGLHISRHTTAKLRRDAGSLSKTCSASSTTAQWRSRGCTYGGWKASRAGVRVLLTSSGLSKAQGDPSPDSLEGGRGMGGCADSSGHGYHSGDGMRDQAAFRARGDGEGATALGSSDARVPGDS